MTRLTTLAAVMFAAMAAFVAVESASAGCHNGYCGPRFHGQGYGHGFNRGFGQFDRFSLQERLILVKRFPHLQPSIFPNGLPAGGAVGGGVVNGAPGAAGVVGGAPVAGGPVGGAPVGGAAAGGPAGAPVNGVAGAAGAPGAAAPGVAGGAPVDGAAGAAVNGAAPANGPAGAPVQAGAVPPAPGAAGPAAPGAVPPVNAAVGSPATPVDVPVSAGLAPILGKWINATPGPDGKDQTTEIELKADGTAEVTVDSGLGRVTLNRKFAVEDGNFTLINGESKQILGSVVSADKDKVVLKKGDVELAFSRP